MKTKTITQQIANEIEVNHIGPMMSGKLMTKEEEKKMAEWVTQRKAALKAKRPRTLLQKIFS